MTVKVADFGLTRDVYVTDYYVVNHNNPLPVKWLAPESLFDKVFSVKTDVVSISDISFNTLYVCIYTVRSTTCSTCLTLHSQF